jgi:hypothetical protein
MARDVKVAKSELMQRYRDWRGHLERIIRTAIREAQDDPARPGRKRREPGRPANSDKNRLLLLREEFTQQCAIFETALSRATAMQDITAAGDQLDRMINYFAGGIDSIGPEP